MTVEITETGECMKVDISGGSASIMVLPNTGAIPQQLASFNIGCFIIDCRGMSSEEGSLMEKLPGRSRFMETTVVLFGGAAEVDEARKAVRKATASQWTGSTRTMEVYTDDSGGAYTAGRRKIVLMHPDETANRPGKVPPMVNLRGAQPQALGWTAVVGLLETTWHTEVETDADGKWLFVASDDVSLPVLLAQRLDHAPSILFCPLHGRSRISDAAAQLGERMQALEAVPVLHWATLVHQWNNLLPLFVTEEDTGAAESGAEEEPEVPVVAPKAPAKEKTPRKKPSLEEKEKKKRVTAVAAPREAPAERSTSSRTPASPAARQPSPPPVRRVQSQVEVPTRSRTPPTRPRPTEDLSRSHSSRRSPERERDRDRRSPDRRRSRSRERVGPRQRGPSPERSTASRSFDVQRRGSRQVGRGGCSGGNERLTGEELRSRLGRFSRC